MIDLDAYDHTPRPAGRLIAATTFIVGVLLGVIIGAVGGDRWEKVKAQGPWIDAGAQWEVLPSHAAAGPLPRILTVPAKAFDYGAASQPLGPLVGAQTSILRVDVEPTSGKAGLLLTSPDGATVLSQERRLTPTDGKSSVYFRVTPQMPPAIIVLRNYDAEGVAGTVVVNAVTYAPQSALSTRELSAINKTGVY